MMVVKDKSDGEEVDEMTEEAKSIHAGTVPGYEIGRDVRGLTQRDRDVLHGLVEGKTIAEIGRALGLTRQRVHQVVKALEEKGVAVDALRKVK